MRVAAAYLAKHTSANEAAARLTDLKTDQQRLVSERDAANARSQAAELALGQRSTTFVLLVWCVLTYCIIRGDVGKDAGAKHTARRS